MMEPFAWMARARTRPGRHAMVRRGTILIALALVATALDEHTAGPGGDAHVPAPLRDAHLLALPEALTEALTDALPGTGLEAADGGADHDNDEPEPPRTIDELRERIEGVLTTHDVPGVGIALVERDGSIWTGGVGVASRETGAAVDGDTVFRVGSITKSVVALAILKLVEEHMLEARDAGARDRARNRHDQRLGGLGAHHRGAPARAHRRLRRHALQ